MNIYNIARKEILTTLRNKQSFIFMLALPIILMLILGTALSNAFSGGLSVGDLNLLYKNTATQTQLNEYWNGFAQAVSQQGVKLTPATPDIDGRAEVAGDRYTGYAEISDDGVHFYGSSKHTMESNILQGMLTSFADRYNLLTAAIQQDPATVAAIMTVSNRDFVQETSLNSDKQPGSLDYYAVAMSTMIAFYSCISGSFLIQGERARKTSIRLSAAPISKGEVFLGKVIGSTVINFVFVVVVVLFSKFVYRAEWGTHYPSILLVLLTEVLLAVSLGLVCSYLFKGGSGRTVVTIITQVVSFLGGAYFPLGDSDSTFSFLPNLSPLRWSNQAITKIIYTNDWSATWTAIGLNTAVAAVFLLLAMVFMRRQEAL